MYGPTMGLNNFTIYHHTDTRTVFDGNYTRIDAQSAARKLSADNPYLYVVYSPTNVPIRSFWKGKAKT